MAKPTSHDNHEFKLAIQRLKQQAIEMARQAKVKQAQHEYLRAHRWLVVPSGLAGKVGIPVGMLTLVIGWVIGDGQVLRWGVFVTLASLWLYLVGLGILVPGWVRVTREAEVEFDRGLSEIEGIGD